MFQRINIRKTKKKYKNILWGMLSVICVFSEIFLVRDMYLHIFEYEGIDFSKLPTYLQHILTLGVIILKIWFWRFVFIIMFALYLDWTYMESEAIKEDIEFLKKNTIEKYGDYLFLYNEVIYKNRKNLEKKGIEPYINHNYHC